MNLTILSELGFSQGEQRVYQALLEQGQCTTGPLIKESGITGSKVYDILNKLIKKGLVSTTIKKKTKYFQAAPPQRLLELLDERELELKKKREKLEQELPNLIALQQVTQNAQVYESYEGIKSVFRLILDTVGTKGTYQTFSLGDELEDKQVQLFLKNHHQKRIVKNISVKLIARKQDKKLLNHIEKLKGVKISYQLEKVPIGTFIFPPFVALISFKNQTAFVIESKNVAENYRLFFESLWK